MSDSFSLIESLLYQNEGIGLDFKRAQYPFTGATDEEKSELLKDILAFANSWRQTTAYILIGVEAVVGDRHIPVGTEDHFDDAQLQQFVNGKTNRKVELSYEVQLFEGKKIGVIIIPKQERPTYSIRRYGKVEKEVVYYRLGSSTAIAKPEDIARMGRDSVLSVATPAMNLQFADHANRQDLGTNIKVFSLAYEKSLVPLPDASERSGHSFGGINIAPVSLIEEININYWRDKEEYIRLTNLLNPLSLVIRNQSSILAETVRVEIVGKSSDGIIVLTSLPSQPDYRRMDKLSRNISNIRSVRQREIQTDVIHHGEQWTLTVSFGNVQPKSCVWADQAFYIGSTHKDQLEIEAVIYADNLPDPQKVILTIRFEIERKPSLTIDVLKRMPPFKK